MKKFITTLSLMSCLLFITCDEFGILINEQKSNVNVPIQNGTPTTISINDVTINSESSTTATFSVTLSQISEQTITVDYNTADVSATGGSDYTGIGTTTLTFNPGESIKTINVTIIDDAAYESDETFNITLSVPVNATILDGTGIGTIIDNDATATDLAFTNAVTIGQQVTVTAGSTEFNMIYANNSTSITFPVSTSDSITPTLTNKFFMAETETTNALFAEVYQWAKDNDKFSTDVSDHDGLDGTTAKHGTQELIDLDDPDCRITYDGTFSAETDYENHPVTHVTWYGAIMFTNWLTEMRDGNTDNVAYTLIDEVWDSNDTEYNPDKTGYRLPHTYEWEYSARYRGTDTTNTVTGVVTCVLSGETIVTDFDAITIKWTKGDSASGATLNTDNESENQKFAVYAGLLTPPTDDAEVKSLGINSKNLLGLYDMSGNVGEWLTNTTSNPLTRSGNWDAADPWASHIIKIGTSNSKPADYSSPSLGFRICRTQ